MAAASMHDAARRGARMRTRKLGSSTLDVSEVGLGCNNFGWFVDAEASKPIVFKALDMGITLFDTADMYGNRGGSEEILGGLLGDRRKDVVLATKFGMAMGDGDEWRGASRRYIQTAVEASLKRLRTDYIDLYQLHVGDPATPIEETLRALDDLVKAGKVRHVGCCNLPAWQFADAQWTANTAGLSPMISFQTEYSLLSRDPERELMPALAAHGAGFLPYFPLAGGMLTGKYKRDATPEGRRLSGGSMMSKQFLTDRNFDRIERLAALAAKEGHSLLDLAFAWLLSRPVIGSVIAGATSAGQVEANVAAAAWRPEAATIAAADEITA
jgi:aryl-alcohol dehydrogenase-like predicted oxidoreductase